MVRDDGASDSGGVPVGDGGTAGTAAEAAPTPSNVPTRSWARGSCAAAGPRASSPARSTAGPVRWAPTTSAPTPPGCAAGSTASSRASPFRGSCPSCSPSASAAWSASRSWGCAPPTSRRPSPASTCPGPGRRRSACISEFSRSDLMLARRGFLGTSLALAAGPTLIEPMQRWLVPVPAGQGGAAPQPDRSRRARPAVAAGAGPAGVDDRDVPPVGRAVRRRPAPQGGGRPAARGHRPPPGAAARGRSPSGCSRSPPNSPNWPAG